MGDAGPALSTNSPENVDLEEERAAFLRATPAASDPCLVELIAIWPSLPETCRTIIVVTARRLAGDLQIPADQNAPCTKTDGMETL
jgi:hypothetical protein